MSQLEEYIKLIISQVWQNVKAMLEGEKLCLVSFQGPLRRETEIIYTLQTLTLQIEHSNGDQMNLGLQDRISGGANLHKVMPGAGVMLRRSYSLQPVPVMEKSRSTEALERIKCPLTVQARANSPQLPRGHHSKRPCNLSELPQSEPLCSLAKERGEASYTGQPTCVQTGSPSQSESGAHKQVFSSPPA